MVVAGHILNRAKEIENLAVRNTRRRDLNAWPCHSPQVTRVPLQPHAVSPRRPSWQGPGIPWGAMVKDATHTADPY